MPAVQGLYVWLVAVSVFISRIIYDDTKTVSIDELLEPDETDILRICERMAAEADSKGKATQFIVYAFFIRWWRLVLSVSQEVWLTLDVRLLLTASIISLSMIMFHLAMKQRQRATALPILPTYDNRRMLQIVIGPRQRHPPAPLPLRPHIPPPLPPPPLPPRHVLQPSPSDELLTPDLQPAVESAPAEMGLPVQARISKHTPHMQLCGGGQQRNRFMVAFELPYAALLDEMPVSSLTWNCTGAVLAVSYGWKAHDAICAHKSCVNVWLVDPCRITPHQPNVQIPLSTCVAVVSFCPVRPPWLAVGCHNGEISVWDVDGKRRGPIARTRAVSNVVCLQWLPSVEKHKHQMATASSNGSVQLWEWDLNAQEATMELIQELNLIDKGVPGSPVNLVKLSYGHDRSFLIGTDSGCIHRFSEQPRATVEFAMMFSFPLHPLRTKVFRSHPSAVTAVQHAPLDRRFFLTACLDGSCRVYKVNDKNPVLTVKPDVGPILSATWSTARPAVIAVGTRTGVKLYDLSRTSERPVKDELTDYPVTAISFNHKGSDYVATGESSGQVKIWHLTNALLDQHSLDFSYLDGL